VVIVNFNQWEATFRLVRQLLRAPGVPRGTIEVMVVDNHSAAHPLARKLRRWPGVSLRRWRRNQGFARAVNEGCRLSRGPWLLVLNPDVTLSEHFPRGVLTLTEHLEATNPRAGITGFALRNPDGSRQLSSGPFPTLARTVAGLSQPRYRRKYTISRARRRCHVPWVTGCCLLLRRECWRDLGGLDPAYFLYYEDVDLCRRARAQGWSVFYEPSLRATHHGPLHGRAVSPRLRLFTRHALLTYASKHWPTWQSRLLAVLVRLEAVLRQRWARWRDDTAAAGLFGVLSKIALDSAAGHHARARNRLVRALRREENVRSQKEQFASDQPPRGSPQLSHCPVRRHPQSQPS
jgi:GT2 family glycosyltransferase